MNDLAAQTVKPSLTGCYLKLKASFFAMWLNSACTDRGLQLEQGACTCLLSVWVIWQPVSSYGLSEVGDPGFTGLWKWTIRVLFIVSV